MTDNTPSIQALLDEELANLITSLYQDFRISNTSLNALLQHLQQTQGKHLRARLVFLIAGAHGSITKQTQRGAVLVTLIHQASLLHDDVIDEANQRRGKTSMNAIWGNKKAILIGDYLLTQCISLALKQQDYVLLEPIAKAAQAMIEGELIQLSQTDPLTMREDICLDIIHKKTASLMAACGAIGAISTGHATSKQVEEMYQLGENIGMAFQIQDDLLDYGIGTKLDKDIGMDIKGQKITLPLYYALQAVKKPIRQEIISKLNRANQEPVFIQEIIDFVHSQGGIRQAQKKIDTYLDQALNLAKYRVPASLYQAELVQFLYSIFSVGRS